MTLKEMRDEVVQTLGLQEIAAYNEGTLVTSYLNRGVIDLLARTRCVVRCVHLQTTPGVDTYTLDHKIMSIVEIGDGAPRARRNEYRGDPYLGVVYPGTDSWGGGFTLIRSDILKIPAPNEAGEIDIWGVLRPSPMVNDTDSPSAEAFGAIPDEYQDAIILYALWKAADYADDQTGQQGERYRLQYEGQDTRSGRLREIRTLINKRGTSKAPGMRGRVRQVNPRSAWVG
jgi:hypothetical protein